MTLTEELQPTLHERSTAELEQLVEVTHIAITDAQDLLEIVRDELTARGRAYTAEEVSAIIRGQEV
ncbi:hypothetical protein [Agrococcus casei]|uniref:Uncharacterized protein n=1 Tax=Agrococcus casei LMG 22410 TaxID=1255656 RepID=A0A1R4GFB5_9MICO|nr:hypothetical protein [Agrococcus casei]SJM66874.1 hypothetical protein CZ674_11540 [Agrococcus casei LMG 22410]